MGRPRKVPEGELPLSQQNRKTVSIDSSVIERLDTALSGTDVSKISFISTAISMIIEDKEMLDTVISAIKIKSMPTSMAYQLKRLSPEEFDRLIELAKKQ